MNELALQARMAQMTCFRLEEIMEPSIDEAKLKDLLNATVVEALHEPRDLVKDIVEAMEDVALTRAIDEGLRGESVPREQVLAIS